jgi:proline iminopeptidase
MGGRHDWICPLSQSVRIARLVPGARLVVFEDSAHALGVDEPEKHTATVLAFLEEAGAGRL